VPQRSLFMLIGAIGLGLLAVLVMRFYIGSGGGAGPATIATAPRSTPVVVAADTLAFGSKIDPAKLKIVQWPADSVPAGSFRSIAAVQADRTIAVALTAGEPLLLAKLSGAGGRTSISTKIPADMRAATVRVSDVTGAGGFILPGERVDILVTRTPTMTEPAFTDVLAQNVRVLAVNQDANEAKDKPEVVQSITVEVTPVQSQKLALASIVGTLSLTLRNPQGEAAGVAPTVRTGDLRDRAVVATPAVGARPTLRRVRRVQRVTRRTVRAPAGTTIEIVRGVESAKYQIARSE